MLYTPAVSPIDLPALAHRLASELDLPLHAPAALAGGDDVGLPDGLRIRLTPCGSGSEPAGLLVGLAVPVPPNRWSEAFCRSLLRRTMQTWPHGVALGCDDEHHVVVLLSAGRDVLESADDFARWVRTWVELGAPRIADQLLEVAAP